MIKTLRFQFPAIIWSVFILILCDMPMPEIKTIRFFQGFDKLAHTGIFFVLTVLLFSGSIRQHHTRSFRLITALKIFAVTVAFGGAIELLQKEMFTYRSADWWDFFADVTGIGMGIFAYLLLHLTYSNEKAR